VNIIYLLPCPCGRKIPIQSRQAGELVSCYCGTTIEVPTLSGLKALERTEIPAEQKAPKTPWNTGHRLIFLGAIVILAAIGIGAWLFWSKPTDPYANFTPEQMQNLAEHLTPIGSMLLWQRLEKGGLEHHKGRAEIDFEDDQAKHQFLWWVWALIPVTGLALFAAGIIVLTLRKKKPLKKAAGGRL
jgi:hypothetical protein